MATYNYDCNMFFDQRSQNSRFHISSCKVEASHGIHYTGPAKENEGMQRIHISNNAYYGHHPIKSSTSPHNDDETTRFMDCEMSQISPYRTPERALTRKRTHDDVSFVNYKRFKHEELSALSPPVVIQVMDVTPTTFARPTHTNPDITRCLMAHMI